MGAIEIGGIVAVFGWMCVVNVSVLAVSGLLLTAFGDAIATLHSNMFGIEKREVKLAHFRFLAGYKILVLALNISPYIALKIMFD